MTKGGEKWRKWTPEEVGLLIERWVPGAAEPLSKYLDRSVHAITCKAALLGLTYDTRLKPLWDLVPDRENLKAIAWSLACEGTVGLRRQHNHSGRFSYDAYIELTSVTPVLVEEFRNMVGAGRIYNYKGDVARNRRDGVHWVLNRTVECLKLLELIREFLPIKQRQADVVIEFCRLRMNTKPGVRSSWREQEEHLYLEAKRLNARGRKGGGNNGAF